MIVIEKYKIIQSMEKQFHSKLNVVYLCKLAKVSRSGFYAYKKRKDLPTKKMLQDEDDFALVLKAYHHKHRNKGAKQIKMTLSRVFDTNMNLKKIHRLMKKFGLVCPIRRSNPYRKMVKAMATNNVHKNILNREFRQYGPGLVFGTDITYLKYNGRFAYLSTIKDFYTNEIVAYKLSKNLELNFVLETVKELLENPEIQVHQNALIQSDQGCHYTSSRYQALLKKHNIIQSMSRRGNCWDNAPMESFFGHMKDEMDIKSCKSFEDVEKEVFDYIDYYNNHRYQWGLDKKTPREYRKEQEINMYRGIKVKSDNPIGLSPIC